MTMPRLTRTFGPAVSLALLVLDLGTPGTATAARGASAAKASAAAPAAPAAAPGGLKGTVRLPDGARAGRLHQGYWRLENGNVPVRAGAAKPNAVVVLTNVSGTHAPPAKTVTVEIAGLDANPRVVVIGPGSVVEFKNVGKVTHDLSTPADVSFMPIERLNPGTFRHQKFNAPGGYVVRCADYPHLTISVLVVDSPYFAFVDEKGAFQIPGGISDGKATLKVWANGRWVHEQSVDTTAKQELLIKVDTRSGKEAEAKDSDSKDSEPGNSDGKESESKGAGE